MSEVIDDLLKMAEGCSAQERACIALSADRVFDRRLAELDQPWSENDLEAMQEQGELALMRLGPEGIQALDEPTTHRLIELFTDPRDFQENEDKCLRYRLLELRPGLSSRTKAAINRWLKGAYTAQLYDDNNWLVAKNRLAIDLDNLAQSLEVQSELDAQSENDERRDSIGGRPQELGEYLFALTDKNKRKGYDLRNRLRNSALPTIEDGAHLRKLILQMRRGKQYADKISSQLTPAEARAVWLGHKAKTELFFSYVSLASHRGIKYSVTFEPEDIIQQAQVELWSKLDELKPNFSPQQTTVFIKRALEWSLIEYSEAKTSLIKFPSNIRSHFFKAKMSGQETYGGVPLVTIQNMANLPLFARIREVAQEIDRSSLAKAAAASDPEVLASYVDLESSITNIIEEVTSTTTPNPKSRNRNTRILRDRLLYGKTIKEIAEEYGLARQRVSMIVKKNLPRIREKMGQRELALFLED